MALRMSKDVIRCHPHASDRGSSQEHIGLAYTEIAVFELDRRTTCRLLCTENGAGRRSGPSILRQAWCVK